jgi:outer membrane protein TolC
MNNYIKIATLCSILCILNNLWAQDTTTLTLPSMKKLIETGLENNYDIKISKKLIDISRGEMRAYDGAFDLSLGADLNLLPGIQPTVESQDEYSFDLFLYQPTKAGLTFSTGVTYLREINLDLTDTPTENVNGVWLQLEMPLLNGLGKNNTDFTNLKVSELGVTSQQINFDFETTVLIKNLIIAYVQVLYSGKVVINYEEFLQSLNELQEDLQMEVDRGLIPKAELLLNNAEINLIKSQLKSARNDLTSSYIELMVLLGEQTKAKYIENVNYDYSILTIPKDTLQVFVNTLVNNRDSLVRENLNFIGQTLNQESAGLLLKQAKNGILNDLNLQLLYNYYAMELNTSFDDFIMFGKSTYPGSSYTISLTYTLPFGNNVSRGTYISASEEYNMQREITDQLHFEMEKAIENNGYSLIDAHSIYEIDFNNSKIRKEIFDNELIKFRSGNSNQINVQQVRRDFIESTLNVYQSEIKYIELLLNMKFLCNKIPKNTTELEDFSLFSLKP